MANRSQLPCLREGFNPNPRILEHIRDCLRELDREHTADEQRQAARALGAEHYLPDPQEALPLGRAA